MSAELQVIRASEFVCLDANAHLDFDASKKSLQGLAQACRKRGLNRALLDLRGLPVLSKPHFDTREVSELAGAFSEAGFTGRQRLAILYDHDFYGIIRDFINFSRKRGLQVEAFLEYEDATSWLSGKQGEDTEVRRAAQVTIAKREVKKQPKKSGTSLPRGGTRRSL
jgi:hypothetical protein